MATGIGICVAGLVALDGSIASSQTLPLAGRSLGDEIAPLGPVVVEADVRAGAAAESMFGAGRERTSFAYVRAVRYHERVVSRASGVWTGHRSSARRGRRINGPPWCGGRARGRRAR